MFNKYIILFALGALSSKCILADSAYSEQSPNIIFVLADDLGWGDLGLFYQNAREESRRHATPELDRLGLQGAQLRRHYCPAPICAPSRASLLSGRHQGHEPVRNMQFDKALADGHTLATVLKAAGYRTAAVGKYGLQGGEKHVYDYDSWSAYPTKRGFDEFFGYVMHIDGHTHYPAHNWPIGDTERHRGKRHLYHDGREIHADLELCYATDLFAAFAKNWIQEHRNTRPEQPFFMYLAYSAPHAALQVPTGPYPEGGGLEGGLQWLGQSGRMINTAQGIMDSWIHPDYLNKDLSEVEKRFATSVRRIDSTMGDLVQTLEDLGIDENTMIVFSSDNGPHNQSYIAGRDYSPESFDSFGPLNGIKADTLEGGIRMPTLVRWPGKVPEGMIVRQISQFHDWMPTFAEIAGLVSPALSDGVSLVPSLLGHSSQRESTVYIEFRNPGKTPSYTEFEERFRGRTRREMQALFLDGYKGIRYNIKSHSDDFEIYDIENDFRESENLAGTNSYFNALQKRMKSRILQIRRPSVDAPRPYDGEFVPAMDRNKSYFGVSWRAFEGVFPWVPQTRDLIPVASGVSDEVDLEIRTRDGNIAIEYRGFVEISRSGNYEFTLDSDTGAILRLHDAVVVDNESVIEGARANRGSILLESGAHPFTIIYYRRERGLPRLDFSYSEKARSADWRGD